MSLLIAPSILSADHARLGEEIRAVEAAGADLLHIDVMDGRFVPNLTFGPPVIRALRKTTRLPFSVHLMIEHPERALAQYVDAGANTLTIHSEACVHLHGTLMQIRALGMRAGVSLNPATPVSHLAHVLNLVDVVLVMTVNPGFSGQAFIPEMLDKVAALAALKRASGHTYTVEVDGGAGPETIGAIARSGAECVVAGSAIFGAPDYRHAIEVLRAGPRG